MSAPSATASSTPNGGDLERAVQLLRAKQHAYYIQAVRDALQSEQLRQRKLHAVTTHLESKRLEKQFVKARARERERLQQIQDDHALLLRAKAVEWRAHGVPAAAIDASSSDASAAAGSATTERSAPLQAHMQQQSPPRKVSKAALSRLATPRVTVQKAIDGRPGGITNVPTTTAGQDPQFLADVYRKQDRERLFRATSQPTLNAENLRSLSETELLHKQVALLQQLHGVVSQQERIVQDDQCTVRSAVSSWQSADTQSTATSS